MTVRWAWLVVLMAAFAAVLGPGCSGEEQSDAPLICHVGGTMRPVVVELAKMYEAQTGRKVEINSAGSGQLLAQIASHRSGDVYVCHDPFLDMLMRRGLGVDGWTLAELTPVIVVRKGNPKNISGLTDLTADDVELLLTDYERSTLGRMLPMIFAKAGIDLAELNERKRIETNRSGSYVANKVQMGNADVAIVWNAVGHLRLDDLDIVPIVAEHLPIRGVDALTSATGIEYILAPVRVTAATLACSTQPEAAGAFAEFLASAQAREVFERFGFTMPPTRREYTDGERNAPTLRLYAGAGLRRGVEKLIARFAAKTGITVEPDYAGSGVILARALIDPEADLFLPGDVWYVDQLAAKGDLVASRAAIAWFVPVIITAKGNPKNIRSLADLAREDVTVGVGDPKACQVGRLTKKILAAAGADLGSETMHSLTVNELGVWVKMGRVDAAIVWDAIAANIADSVDVVAIPVESNRISRVVMGVMRTSDEIEAAELFMHFVAGSEGRAILAEMGFRTAAPEAN